MTLHRRTFTLPVLAALLLGCGINLLGDDAPNDRQTLKGIKAIRVIVEDLDTAAISDGLTRDQIQTAVELRLRLAGIKVDSTASPYLYVRASLLKASTSLYAYNIDVELNQRVFLVTTGDTVTGATWSVGGLGMVASLNVNSAVLESIGKNVDKFLNAYLSVNPK